MKKAVITILPLIFTAQACDFLTGGLLSQRQSSGSMGIFLSTDSGQTWEEVNKISKEKSLAGVQISQIIFIPNHPKNLLISTFNAGLYASENGGEQWFGIFPGFAVQDVWLSPKNVKEILAAGSRNQVAVIYKSIDAGATWTQIYSEPQGPTAVTSIISDPRNPGILYAGLSTGTIIRSTDAGNNWRVVINLSDRVQKLLLTPDARNFYMLGRSQGIRRSQDLGQTWTQIEIPDSPGQYHDLIFEPGNASTMYVVTDKGLFRSGDGGASWGRLTLPVSPEVQGVSAATVNPQNKRQIFVGILSTIYRSDDAGATWRPVTIPTGRQINRIAVDPYEPNRIYVGFK